MVLTELLNKKISMPHAGAKSVSESNKIDMAECKLTIDDFYDRIIQPTIDYYVEQYPTWVMRGYKLRSDYVAVRELPADPDSTVIHTLDNPNKRPGTVLTGIVLAVGPGRLTRRGVRLPVGVTVGDKVWYEIEQGVARLPWDFDVRIMRADSLAGVGV